MLEQLFKFPIAMVDGDNEERKVKDKQRFGDMPHSPTEEKEDYDVVYGEAQYPYWDFIGIEDRWIPIRDSFAKALSGKFEACLVKFVNVGSLLVPWSKEKFLSKLTKHAEDYKLNHPPEIKLPFKIKTLTEEEARKEISNE